MKAKIMGRTIEIPDERVRGGVVGTRRESIGLKGVVEQSKASGTPVHTGKTPALPVRSMPIIGGAGSNPAPSPPGWPDKKDRWNYAYAQYLELERQAGGIVCWWFEPSSYWLPGGLRYKPDFLVWYPEADRKLEYVEVKGWSRNIRDGITRYKIAASLFPCFTWKMVKRKGHGWEEYT